MKSATIAAALLASVAVAQPHGHKRQHHHEKRDYVTEWETVWETATVVIGGDSTQTIGPSPHETTSGYAGQFFQPDASSSSSSTSSTATSTTATSTVSTAETQVATAEAAPQTTQTTPTTTVSSAQTTYQAASPTTLATTTSQAATTYPTTTAEATTEATTSEAATSTYAASSAASSTASSSGSTSSDGIQYATEYSGQITYYNVGLGACGYDDTGKDDTTNIVAIPEGFWDAISTATSYGIDQPAHPLCDKTITITAPDGTTAKATIRDRCAGCSGHAIDVTPHTFSSLFGSLTAGRLDCTWEIDE
ncbi:hypothetical protein GGR53DRAFT_500974 [Hypoxylon sp. FL1150]|nr:hypothetical protein GGR53DRAFT_500974 [Hypoxylon sp. FL1150]